MTPEDVRKIVTYCSEEVRRQGRGPIQVGNMVDAWMYAVDVLDEDSLPNTNTIIKLGNLVEPTVNSHVRFRNLNVRVGMHIAPDFSTVTAKMHRFCDHIEDMTAEEAYFEFEYIHPFQDGNGRVGKIIYNWKLGTLLDPHWPPNKWGISNP